jgi:DNA repair exonuclease SbcCD nuclease subunit
VTRLLAFADTQLGVQTVTLQDQRDVLDRIIQVALDRNVDAVLHGGDVFEGPVITPEQHRAFIDGVRPLRDANIPLFICVGNGRHDAAVRSVHALDVLREVDGIQVADSPTVAVLAGKVAVCALPWVHPGRLVAQANGSLTHDEADLTISQMLVRIAKHLYEKAESSMRASWQRPGNPDWRIPTVLLAHWSISGSALPTGLPVDEMREPVLSWADLDAIGFDAVVGAHIHQPQQISQPLIDRTLGIVVGSPQQLNFGEHGEHGCWILDFDPEGEPFAAKSSGSASAEFVPIPAPQFVTVDLVDDEGNLVAMDDLPAVIDGDRVRIRYRVTEEESRKVDLEDTKRRVLRGAIPSRIQVEPTIIRKERARAQQISEQLSPVDALEEYCAANEVEAARTLAMLARLKEWGDG